AAHLTMLTDELNAWHRVSRDLMDTEDEAARATRFVDGVMARIAERIGAEAADTYRAAVPLDHCWQGLERYWKKRLA
ncbi:MAG: hypothetical protein Q7V01_06260, partial [Vicinamibacterales bacterium]|nr:hypothetical protein [Vicinamibacterales bacterium]